MRTRIGLALSVTVLFCTCVIGCRDVPTIWKAQASSPDGRLLASALTEQNGGFGSADITTVVYLKRTDGTVDSGRPIEVLEFSCDGPAPRPYVLDEANAGGTIDLTMKWLNPSHLEVTYHKKADLDFQVVKVAGIDISVRDLSKASITSLP